MAGVEPSSDKSLRSENSRKALFLIPSASRKKCIRTRQTLDSKIIFEMRDNRATY